MLSFRRKDIWKCGRMLLIMITVAAGLGEAKGQRKYATVISKIPTTTGVTITNESKAITSNENIAPTETSPLANISVSGTGGVFGTSESGWVGLGFASIPANTIVFIKVSGPTYLGSGGTIAAQAYNNSTLVASSSTLLTAKDGTLYYAVSAISTINTVRLNVTGNGGLLIGAGTASINLLSAFYNTINPADCGTVLGTDGFNATNLQRAIDGDKSTFSTLAPGALLSSANQNFYFSGASDMSDELKITMSAPASVLSVSLLNNISISGYNGSSTTPVWTVQLGNILSADLLGLLGNATPITFSVAPGVAIDKVTVNFSSVLSLFSNLYIHEIERTPKKPSFALPSQQNVNACAGIPITLAPNAPPAGSTFKWYDASTDGNLLANGATYTVTPVANITYYVATAKSTCSGESLRVPVTLTVSPQPNLTSNLTTSICSNSPFSYTAVSSITGTTFSWTRALVSGISNSAGSGNTSAINETLINTSSAPVTVTYQYILTAPTGCPNTQNVSVVVNPLPAAPSGTAAAICTGTNGVFNVTSPIVGYTYHWFATAVGGAPLLTGSTVTTPSVLTANLTYYLEATSSLGCTNPARTAVSITVNPKLTQPQVNVNSN